MPHAKAVLSASLRRLAREGRLRRLAETPTLGREIVYRYVAGENVGAAVQAAADLIDKRRLVCLTSLQPVPETEEDAAAVGKRYRKVLRRLDEAGLASGGRCEVSFALDALGAELGAGGRALALELARRICRVAANTGALVTIESHRGGDMDAMLETVADLRQDFPFAGVSLPAALRRTESDVRDQLGSRVRLWGGHAGGPDRFGRPAEVDRSFARCLRLLLAHPEGTPVIATQDPRLLEIAEALARHHGRRSDSYEVQLRYGVRPAAQANVGDRGDRMRVYTPFGVDWYAYLISRVADDPTNVGDLLKAAFAR